MSQTIYLNMKIIITEEQKKKLFIPRKLSSEDSRYSEWNNRQPIKDGVRINQYDIDGNKQGYWEYYYYNSDGKLQAKGSYVDNEKEGLWIWYRLNGVLWEKSSYVNGKFNGISEDYDEDGNLEHKSEYKNGKKIKRLSITESDNKKKLFIPRKIDEREIEAEKLKQKFISEIKEIIEEEGMIGMGELQGNPIEYDYEFNDEIAQIEEFYSDYVIVIVYGGHSGSEEVESFQVNYDELDLQQLMRIRELLETYDAH